MSWSVNFIGKPDNIVKALENESERLTGESKKEFDIICPMLACLVRQNFNNTSSAPVLQLIASGHTASDNGNPMYGNLSVTLDYAPGIIV